MAPFLYERIGDPNILSSFAVGELRVPNPGLSVVVISLGTSQACVMGIIGGTWGSHWLWSKMPITQNRQKGRGENGSKQRN